MQFYLRLGTGFSITGGIRFGLPFPVDTNASNYFATHNINRVQMYLAGSTPRYHLADAAPYDNQIATFQYLSGANGDPTDVNANNLWTWTETSWIKCVYDYERG